MFVCYVLIVTHKLILMEAKDTVIDIKKIPNETGI